MTNFVELTEAEYEVLSPLDKARYVRQKNKLRGIVTDTSPYAKLERNPTSLRARINAMCFHCANDQRREVTMCAVTTCPLYPVRPWQDKKNVDNDEQDG